MKRIAWTKVSAGDVIQFRYRSKKQGSKSRLRVCLILNEKHMYKRKRDGKNVRLIHAVQLSAIPRVKGTKLLREANILKLFKKYGKIELRDEGSTTERFAIDTTRAQAKGRYGKIANLVESYGNYRTFSWNILKTRVAILNEEWEWPRELVEELKKREPVINEDEL